MELKPFVKWAGGKRQILSLLRTHLPKTYNHYFEPFLGGGALFLDLQPKSATIGDINPELINAFEVIKLSPKKLIKAINKLKISEVSFYRIRKLNPNNLSEVDRAARFIFLNKTCFNGLYRENSKGQFNAPYGHYTNPKVIDETNILNLHEYLNKNEIHLVCADYRQILLQAKAGDLIYLDSPYYPIKDGSFTKYSKNDFTKKDHEDLATVFKTLSERGCLVLMSNSNTKFIKDLYKGFSITEVFALRSINSQGKGRKKQKVELIIKNF